MNLNTVTHFGQRALALAMILMRAAVIIGFGYAMFEGEIK